MKFVEINAVPYGSTGRIMFSIADLLEEKGHEVLCTSGFSWVKTQRPNHVITSGLFFKSLHIALGTITGMNGCFSVIPTIQLIRRLRKIRPDVIHLHNLHGSYLNLGMLFSYIKKQKIRVMWTLHDCWSFTGQCPHFTMVRCDKWKTGCYHCPQYREYPATIVDQTKIMWKLKKKWFTGVEDMTIITPSRWLADLVKESYLKDYPVRVIHNGINLEIFKPTPSDIRKKLCIEKAKNGEKKYLILGVALGWGERKGLDVFIKLSKRLPYEYQIVLVGTDENVDAKLPDNIISIHRTQNQTELAKIYTAADLFVNPTREDNYPTVNLEARACGTPVLTFRTGGSPECIDEHCGCVVECDDVDALEREIIRICEKKPYSKEACTERAKAFDMNDRFMEYIQIGTGGIS